MGYLVGQIILCLLIAFVLGFVIGCLFCRSRRTESVDDIDWAGRHERLKNDHAELQGESGNWAVRFEQLKQSYERLKDGQVELQQERNDWKEKHDALLVAKDASQVTTHEYREGLVSDDYPYPVEEVEGIGKGFGKKLRDLGIETTEDLLQRCCTNDGWEETANRIGLKEQYVVRKWASMADLMRVPGVMGQFAELLEFSGVESVQDLSTREPDQLLEKLKKVNEREHRVKEVPGVDVVSHWINSAKSLSIVMK